MKTIFKTIFLLIFSCVLSPRIEASVYFQEVKPENPVLLLFTPGLEEKNITQSVSFLTRRSFTSFSRFPLINFLEILLGAEGENQFTSRFFAGGKIITLKRAQLNRLSWLDLASDFKIFTPYSRLLKSSKVIKRTVSPGRVSILVRERKIALGQKFNFFIKPRGRRPGAKWTVLVRKFQNRIFLELPSEISVFGKDQRTIELEKDKGLLLILKKGNRVFNLYLHVREFFADSVIFYQKGPQRGFYSGKPDAAGLKNEYIGAAIFGGEFLSSLQAIFRNIMWEGRTYNLLFLDFAAELERYLMRYDQNEIIKKWKNIAGKKLGSFIKKWKDKYPRGQIYWLGMTGMVIVEKRLDLGQLLNSDKLLLLENGSEALLYPWGFSGNIWEFYHYVSEKLSRYKKLRKYWQLVPGKEFIKVILNDEFRAGACRRGSFICADYSGGNWGYPRARIVLYTNDSDLPDKMRSPAQLGEHFFYTLKKKQ